MNEEQRHNEIEVFETDWNEAGMGEEPRLRRGNLLDDFNNVMADERGQSAVEMTIMLAMLTGAIIFTNEIFDTFLTTYIDRVMYFLSHP
jgi:Flp pilus assembly pilin Flp